MKRTQRSPLQRCTHCRASWTTAPALMTATRTHWRRTWPGWYALSPRVCPKPVLQAAHARRAQLCLMMGSWTDPLLKATDVFSAMRATGASETVQVDDSARRTSQARVLLAQRTGSRSRACAQVVCAPGALRVAAAVLPHLPRSGARSLLLAALWAALRGSASNVAAACRADALPWLLAALAHCAGEEPPVGDSAPPQPDEELPLLRDCCVALASWSAPLRHVRGWLARCGRCGPAARCALLRVLRDALRAPHARAPTDVYTLDGESSGMLCLPHPRWPFKTGFAFCTWLYVESFAGSDADAAAATALASAATAAAKASPASSAAAAALAAGEGQAYMPRLFSFLSSEGQGLEAYFHGPYLVLEAKGASGYRATVTFSRAIPARCWLTVCVEATETEARLYMDGALWDAVSLNLPRVSSPLAFTCVGTNPPAAMVGLQRRRRQCAMAAALGCVYVFRAPLGPALVAKVAARGADHVPSFGMAAPPRARAGGYVPGSRCFSVAEAVALDAELAGKMLQVYHPRLRIGGSSRIAPDISPACPPFSAVLGAAITAGAARAGGAAPRGAVALGGVTTAHRRTLADALWALGEGGPACLLPLVPPSLGAAPGLMPQPQALQSSAAAALVGNAAASAVEAIALAAAGHPGALYALASASAPRALAAALPAVWAACFPFRGDAAVVASHAALARAVVALAATAHAHEPLARQVYACLILDLTPWAGAARSAQQTVLRCAAAAAHSHGDTVRALGGLRRLLDSGRRHLGEEGPGTACDAAAQLLVDDAFVAAELLCGAGGTEGDWRADLRALVGFAASSSAPGRDDVSARGQAARALLLAYTLVSHPSAARREPAMVAFVQAGGCETLLLLLRQETVAAPCPSDAQRQQRQAAVSGDIIAGCLRLITALLCSGRLSTDGNITADAALSAARFAMERAPAAWASRASYDALLRGVMGGGRRAGAGAFASPDVAQELCEANTASSSSSASQASGAFPPQPQLLRCLLPALPFAPPPARAAALRDLLLLTCAHAPSRAALPTLPEWPDWLAACAIAAPDAEDSPGLALNFFAVTLERALRMRTGWRACERCLHALRAAALAVPDERRTAARALAAAAAARLLTSLLRFVAAELRKGGVADATASSPRASGATLGWPPNAALSPAASSGAAAAAAAAAASAGAAGAAAGASARDVMQENAVALLALTETALRSASREECATSSSSHGPTMGSHAAKGPYGPGAARVAAAHVERWALAAAETAETDRCARDAGLALPPALDTADDEASLETVDVPLPQPRSSSQAAQSSKPLVDELLDSLFQGPVAMGVFGGAPAAVAMEPVPSSDKPRSRAAPPSDFAALAEGEEPFEAPQCGAAWGDTLLAACAAAEELVHGAELARRSEATPVAAPPASATLGAELLASEPARMMLARLTLAAMRSGAEDDCESHPSDDAAAAAAAPSRTSRLQAVLHRLLAPLLAERPEGPGAVRVLAVTSLLFDELWPALRRLGASPQPCTAALEFAAWRAGLDGGGAMATFADMTGGTGQSSQHALSDAAYPAHAVAHAKALMVPFAALMRHWRCALAVPLADAFGRSPLRTAPETADASFAGAPGLGDAALRGAARLPPAQGAALFLTPAWAAAMGGRGASAARLATGRGTGHPASMLLSRHITAGALAQRAEATRALRDARCAGWARVCHDLASQQWASASPAAARVAAALAADAPRRAAHAAAGAAAVAARARAWQRLTWHLSEAGLLFAGGPGGAPALSEAWTLDATEDGARARRRLRREHEEDGAVAPLRAAGASTDARWSVGGTTPAAAASFQTPPAARGGGDLALLDHPEEEEEEGGVGGVAQETLLAENAPLPSPARVPSATACHPALWVTPLGATPGTLSLTPSDICFAGSSPLSLRRWSLSSLLQIHARRYRLRRSALELFLVNRGTLFFDVGSVAARQSFYTALLAAVPPLLASIQGDPPAAPVGGQAAPSAVAPFARVFPRLRPASKLLRRELTQRWQRRELSNFGYLMELNTLAGRSFNDLSQWPVFPWVLADYSSPVLDLHNPASFRDLSKPVGALNPERAARFRERYAGWEDPLVPPFHYGSHYSSAATVLHYLLRLQPFTRAALELQGGRLDHADRLFHDVSATWRGVTGSSLADVQELTPEWFSLPEMFLNCQGLELGTRQTGEALGDVALPPWAANAHHFVTLHRAALESEHVSANLHLWIDLVFGAKQRGAPAVSAQNVFYYLTYEGGVDVEAIRDPLTLRATQDQIAHYGQTPSQLLSTPHPPRWAAGTVRQPVCSQPTAMTPFMLPLPPMARAAALHLSATPGGGIAVVTAQLQVLTHGLRCLDEGVAHLAGAPPFLFTPAAMPAAPGGAAEALAAWGSALLWGDATAPQPAPAAASARKPPRPGPAAAASLAGDLRLAGLPSAPALLAEAASPGRALLAPDASTLILGGLADGSLRAFDCADGLRCAQAVTVHRAPITALALSPCGRMLAAASRDCTVSTWLLCGAAGGALRTAAMTAAEQGAQATPAAAVAAAEASDGADAEIDAMEAELWAMADEGAAGAKGAPPGADCASGEVPASAAQPMQPPAGAAHLSPPPPPPAPPLRGPLHFLRGCPEAPASVALCTELDCLAVACPSAGLALFSLLRGRLARRVAGAPGTLVCLSREGYACVFDPAQRMLRCVSLNGHLVATAPIAPEEGLLTAMTASADGRTLVTGSAPDAAGRSTGRVLLRALPTLAELYRFSVPEGSGVASLLLTQSDFFLLVATTNGQMLAVTDPRPPPPRPVWDRIKPVVQYD